MKRSPEAEEALRVLRRQSHEERRRALHQLADLCESPLLCAGVPALTVTVIRLLADAPIKEDAGEPA